MHTSTWCSCYRWSLSFSSDHHLACQPLSVHRPLDQIMGSSVAKVTVYQAITSRLPVPRSVRHRHHRPADPLLAAADPLAVQFRLP